MTGLAVRAGGGRWEREWRGSPGSASPARGRRLMRPSWRTATSGRGGPTRRRGSASARRPGYLKLIERWSARREWRGAGRRLGRPPASRARQVAAEEAAKWERRRLQALEEGWQTLPGAAGQAGADARHRPRRSAGRRPARAGRGDAGGHPRRRRDARGGQGDGGTRAVAVERPDGDAAVEAGRRAGVGAHHRDLAAPREDRPADGDARGAQGLPGPQSPPRPTPPRWLENRSCCLPRSAPQEGQSLAAGRKRGCGGA